jgi:Zn finger protein HypA/HybF involved in hydrogenase expression
MTEKPPPMEERDKVTIMCWWCLQPLAWDDAQKRLWCPACHYEMPNG